MNKKMVKLNSDLNDAYWYNCGVLTGLIVQASEIINNKKISINKIEKQINKTEAYIEKLRVKIKSLE